jgi:17beta-estradiol 17-dehydrogenase / very-long-chain 3-oxoacyl-CoA reductase
MGPFYLLLLCLGALSASVTVFRLLRFIYIYTRPSSISRYCHVKANKPAWALVTGASDGIGLALSHELAYRGFNVVVHGRNEVKLQGIVDTLTKEFPERSFRYAAVDACLPGQELIERLKTVVDSLKDINLTVLVNNIGGPPSQNETHYTSFDKTVLNDNENMMALNIRFPTQLTGAILPVLLKHQPSLILTIGSMAEEGNAWLTVYSGSKGFQTSWCKGLAREMKAEGRDVEVLSIRTGQVTDVSHNQKQATMLMPTAKTYASAVLDRVGCGQAIVNGYWSQAMVKAFVDTVPDSMFSRILEKAMRRQIADYLKQK